MLILDGLFDQLDDVDNGAGALEVTLGVPWLEPNTDSSGLKNYVDIDSDDDGVIDLIEAQLSSGAPIIPTNIDADFDGISSAFDPDEGGVYQMPENTDGLDSEDYVDNDSDDDGEIDQIEGWDTNGDGIPEILPSGIDTDGDGLDDSFDLLNGVSPLFGSTNNGQDAFDFPNADAGSDERDWRELPCQDGDVGLADPGVTVAVSNCKMSGWTYFYDPSDATKLLFAVNQFPPGGGANSNDFTIEAQLISSDNPASEAGVYSATDIANQTASFVLGRYYNITLTSGNLNGYVDVRFYFNPAELDTLEQVAQRWNQLYADQTSQVSGLRWFNMNSGTFDTTQITPGGILNAYDVTTQNLTLEAGIDYVEFSTSTLTGGSVAYSVGVNSIILPVEILNFDAGVIDNKYVQVIWQTSSESNSDRFFVEKSSNGRDWIYVGEVAAAGNSNTAKYYELFDSTPFFGTSYYRLHEVDFDGSVITTPAKKVNLRTGSNNTSLLVYPNPNTGNFEIELFSDLGISGVVEVCTMTGTSVGIWNLGSISVDQHSLQIQSLTAGHYLVMWRYEKTVMTTKVIVN